MEGKSHYEILGLKRKASREQIEEAYRVMAEIYNPSSDFFDEIITAKPSEEQSAMFNIITAAYNTLIDPVSRDSYDKSLPLEIPGWSDPEEEARKKLITSTSVAYGVFGNGNKPTNRAFENVILRDSESVADIVGVGKEGLLLRCLKLFRR